MNREQLKTILWLRWRLTRNQWKRSSGLGAVLAVLVAVGAFLMGALMFAGGLLGGAFGLGESAPVVVMGVWFGLTVAFLFFWFIGLLAELQRSETIDLQKLMHLPVALGQMFVVNYLASHLALSIILMVPAMTGLALGLAFSRGLAMALLLPLAWSMVLMITAWTYCLRGWLATLMSNPRRRRAIIMGITLAFILVAQLPNFYFNVLRRHDRPKRQSTATPEEVERQRDTLRATGKENMNTLIALQKFVPPLWLPQGALGLAEHRILPALLGTLGCAGIGTLGLRRAYRSTMRFYHGDTGAKTTSRTDPISTPVAKPAPQPAGRGFLETRLPLVSEQATATALATFRSMLRAPEVKMAWATTFIVLLVVGASVFLRSGSRIPAVAKPFFATGSAVFTVFTLLQFLANQFGLDRDGFRTFILSPADRRHILVGKNLASIFVGAVFGMLLLGIVAIGMRLPMLTVVATLFQLAATLLLAGMAGNCLSILIPYRVQAGSMKPTKMPALAMLVMVLCQLLFPLAMLPVFMPPLMELVWRAAGWPDGVPVNLLLSGLLAGLAALAYWQTLGPLGRLLQRRETKILNVVTAEVE